MSRIPVWIDTDTGVDDAIALLTAVYLDRLGQMEIKGVSSVCGNVEQEKTFVNARNVLYLAGREDIRVYPGADRPLTVPLETAAYIHGENGLGGAKIPISPASFETEKAWDAMYRAARECEGNMELILLGPETNAATAFIKYPDFKQYLKRILIMGGADVGGNRTPSAEFNIYVDPHAAQVIFKSGVPVVMCGLDVTMKAGLTLEEIEKIESSESRGCRLFRESTGTARKIYEKNGAGHYFVHDACPVLFAVCPEMFMGEQAGVFVETRGRITRGKTVSDRDTDVKFGVKNTFVVLDLHREQFAFRIIEALENT